MEQKISIKEMLEQFKANFEKAVAAKKAEDAKKEEAVEEAPVVEAPKKRGRKKKVEETAE